MKVQLTSTTKIVREHAPPSADVRAIPFALII